MTPTYTERVRAIARRSTEDLGEYAWNLHPYDDDLVLVNMELRRRLRVRHARIAQQYRNDPLLRTESTKLRDLIVRDHEGHAIRIGVSWSILNHVQPNLPA